MNKKEFDGWLKHHSSCFPGLTDWLSRSPGTAATWQDAMAKATADDARQASKDMLSGEAAKAYGFAEHMAVVCGRVKEIVNQRASRERRWIDGQQVYRCTRCYDSGLVSVFSPRSMRERKEGVSPFVIRSCSVACDCDEGGRFRDQGGSAKYRPLPTWSSDRMVRVTGETQANVAELDAHLASVKQSKRITAFDEWNQR